MAAEARLKSKNLYKVELYLLKIMPMVIALAYLVNTVSSYFGVDIPIWQYIGYTPQRDNDEVDAYLLTYIYNKITQVFYKHKDDKE
jgi:hypothetical protein